MLFPCDDMKKRKLLTQADKKMPGRKTERKILGSGGHAVKLVR
jgi:hypothetical protein